MVINFVSHFDLSSLTCTVMMKIIEFIVMPGFNGINVVLNRGLKTPPMREPQINLSQLKDLFNICAMHMCDSGKVFIPQHKRHHDAEKEN